MSNNKIMKTFNGYEIYDEKARNSKVNLPIDSYGNVNHGNDGQVLISKGNGKTEWKTPSNIDGGKGQDGASAYDIAVTHGFEGNEEEWLESLKGKDGSNGANGLDGKDGQNGTNGSNGADGEDGVGIETIEQMQISLDDNGENILKITLTNGQIALFKVCNGSKGSDGADGKNGVNGVSPKIVVEKIEGGHEIMVTDYTGTQSFEVMDGQNGVDGKDGYTPVKGVDYFDGQDGAKGDKGDKGETGAQGVAGKDGKDGVSVAKTEINSKGELVITLSDNTVSNLGVIIGAKGEKGDKGDTGAQGIQGVQGEKGDTGETGEKGSDGVSATHSWNGTTLIITSASGTSSADLKGEKGDTGEQGEQGISGVYVGSGEMPEGYNVQIDPDGEALEVVTKEELQQLSETVINNNNISTKHFNNTDIHVTDEEKVLWNNKCGENVTGKIQTDSSGNEYTGGTNAERFNGDINVAKGEFSHAEGYITIASGDYSHSEGHNTLASGARSHAEGNLTKSTADASHAEGDNTTASGISSHAEGDHTNAVGVAAHAEGTQTSASGIASHSEGKGTTASADYTHAQGHSTVATGWASHAEGRGTKAISNSQHVQGRWNIPVNHIHVVGCGSGEDGQVDDKGNPTYRANIHHLTTEGEGWFAKGTSTTNADYAEYYEWLDGNPDNEDRIGLLVTLDGEKIKLANPGDEILGVISGTAAVIGDDPASSWKCKYLTDDFGRVIYEDREDFEEIIVEKINEETGETYEEIEMVSLGFSKYPVLNPEYDPTQEYIPRSERPEWDIVGLLGKLYVRDDRTATVNGHVTVGKNGIATASTEKTNMRVLSRVKENIIKIQKQ